MNPLDMLNDDVAVAPDNVIVTTPARGELTLLRTMALDVVPKEYHGTLLAGAADAGIQHVNDPAWLIVAAEVVSLAAATACGVAAQAVQAGVASIPDQIFNGAVRASDEVKGGLVSGAKLFVEAFTQAATDRQKALETASDIRQTAILAAADLGADKIRNAADSLTSSLDTAVQAKTDQGVSEFAKAAAVAGQAAAQSSMLAQLSRSALVSVVAFLFACGVGAGGLWGYLLIPHRVMPQGITVMTDPFSHKPVMTLPSGSTAVLPGQIPDQP